MRQLIYASRADDTLTWDDLHEILSVAHKENERHGISGLLVYDGKFFLQCIEGEEAPLKQLMQNLQKDSRHSQVTVLAERETDHRDFAQWVMGFMNSSPLIHNVIRQETAFEEFTPHAFDYEEAKRVLLKLVQLI